MGAPESLIETLGCVFDDWSVQSGALDEALEDFHAEYDRLIEKAKSQGARERTKEIMRHMKDELADIWSVPANDPVRSEAVADAVKKMRWAIGWMEREFLPDEEGGR